MRRLIRDRLLIRIGYFIIDIHYESFHYRFQNLLSNVKSYWVIFLAFSKSSMLIIVLNVNWVLNLIYWWLSRRKFSLIDYFLLLEWLVSKRFPLTLILARQFFIHVQRWRILVSWWTWRSLERCLWRILLPFSLLIVLICLILCLIKLLRISVCLIFLKYSSWFWYNRIIEEIPLRLLNNLRP